MVRARITTAAATTATEIQKMGARTTRCMMVVLVLRVGNPGGSPFHPSIRAPSEIGSRSGIPVCMGRHADRRNRGAPPRLRRSGAGPSSARRPPSRRRRYRVCSTSDAHSEHRDWWLVPAMRPAPWHRSLAPGGGAATSDRRSGQQGRYNGWPLRSTCRHTAWSAEMTHEGDSQRGR